MHQRIGSALVQTVACCLFSTKPLSKPMLGYSQLDPWEQTSVKFESKFEIFHSRKCIWKCHWRNGGHFFLWGDEFKVEYRSYFGLTKDTPHLALTDQLWGVYCECIGENQQCYKSALPYVDGLVQESALAMELRLSCTNPSMYYH